ncbi:MAG: ATP-binding protein [Dehalococcoidia bacterium]|nr:ATP-binding protein [Dehalococcoidia bacterium]
MSFIHSVKFRFTIWYLAVLALLLIALSIGIYFLLSHSLTQNLDNSLELRSNELRNTRGFWMNIRQGSFHEDVGEVVIVYFYSENVLVTVSGRNIDVPVDSALVENALSGQSSFSTINMTGGQKLRLYVTPFAPEGLPPAPPGSTPVLSRVDSAALVIGRSTADIDDALERLVRILLLAVPLTLAVAGAGGVFLARRALKPVDQIAQTALQIEEKDLSQRIPVDTKDELGRLATVLNQMIERLEKAFKRQRQFAADASHELRTPLAVIQAESTLALEKDRPAEEYRSSLELVVQESEHMSHIISQLLTLARADSGKEQMTFETIDLGKLIGDVVQDAEVLSREKGLRFELGRMDNAMVTGDKARLKELLLNLLDNAIRYTPTGGTVSLSLVRQDRMAVMAIKDTGIGIPPEHLPHIFGRFYRVDKARSRTDGGSGLGLAICQHIVESHGGRIEVESQIGKGSTFSVFLPLSEERC